MSNDVSDAYYKAIIARRDRRFDGRFYFGVKTTGIYCRPVCPAKAKPENMIVFKSGSEAEKAGYRPCLRCHPDLAPGHRMYDPAHQVIARALKMVNEAPDDGFNIKTLARKLNMTDRHLRRIFDQHLGVSPVELLITRRLHFAKQMIQETLVPLTDIVFAVGFGSIRRFNEAFKEKYTRTPSSFRKPGREPAADGLILKIPIRLPYDWAVVLAYLGRHEAYGIEEVRDDRYRRFVPQGKTSGTVTVSHQPGTDFLQAQFVNVPLTSLRGILARLKNLFDTDHNPLHLPAVKAPMTRGIRVPGSFDPFETAVSIILSQLVSTEHARLALKKLIRRFGRKMSSAQDPDVFAFPTAKILARAAIERIGIPKTRARAIRELAQTVSTGAINFRSQPDLETAKQTLLDIHGIGPWTATLIAMRCLGDADAFPEQDLVIHRVLKKKNTDSSAWVSSRAYLTHCLWRDFSATSHKSRRLR
jgi:AraC family transcriptional regulator of adaptative response / DNA-3-methyladenine glycosylase II